MPTTPRRFGAALLSAALLAPGLATLVSAPASAAPGDPAPFGAGNVLVSRVTGTTNAAQAVVIDEYTPSGTLVQSVPLPTAAAGAQRALTLSGSATSEGALSLSADGRYVAVAGYDAAPGTASIAGTSSASVNRVIGRIGADAKVDTSTATTLYNANNIRGAVTEDGSKFYTAGPTTGAISLVDFGASTGTTISGTNSRVPVIADGQLYATSGSAPIGVNKIGTGLPTAAATATSIATTNSPYGAVFLDRDPNVPGVDTLYVADDVASVGLVKWSLQSGTWTKVGNYSTGGALRGLTGKVSGSSATFFAVTAAATGGNLVQLTDTAASNAAPAVTATPVASPPSGASFRGVTFAPQDPAQSTAITTEPADTKIASGQTATLTVAATGTNLTYQWFTAGGGAISGATGANFTTPSLTATTSYYVVVSGAKGNATSRTATVTVTTTPPPAENTAPTITRNTGDVLPLTVQDPDGAPAARTVDIADAESPASSLVTSVTSSDDTIATATVTGSGATRTLAISPQGVGYATLTVSVSDGDKSASTTFGVAVSGALPAGTRNLYGASDASAATPLAGGRMAVADDETNTLRVYDRTRSGYPVASLDLRAAGLTLPDADVTREVDIEAAATYNGVTYWLGSHGQNKDNKVRLNRQVLFTTTADGSTLSVGGSYRDLRSDLIAWDNGRGAPLGLAAAANRAPEADPSGFNIEGAEFSADGSTLYLAFRGPLTTDGKAIVVPVTNPQALVSANPTTGVSATFGTPLSWDLGGRGIRDIRRNATGDYVIIAGPTGDPLDGTFALYRWNGSASSAPAPLSADLADLVQGGKPEAIVDVPSPLTASSALQILTDSGTQVWYGGSTIAKDLELGIRKATVRSVLAGDLPACSSPVATIGSVQGTTDISPAAGTTVTVRGTVVGDYEGGTGTLQGFYLQDSGDGDAATSDGIFVFEGSSQNRNLVNGDVVEVTGPVSEFQGQTQITGSAAAAVTKCGITRTVTPTDVTLPNVTADALEKTEGMLVRFNQTLTVTEHFQLGRFGQVVLSSGGRLSQPTQVAPPGSAAGAIQLANDRNRVIVDDASQLQNPDPITFGRGGQPLSAENTLRGGDTTTNPVGVLTYTWSGNSASGNAYRLRPVGALGGSISFDPTNPRPAGAPSVGAAGVKVASANLLNFFNTFTGCTGGVGGAALDCRGAENTNEYNRQLAKTVANIRGTGADVVGVMELENDGYGATSAGQALVDALNDVDGANVWAWVDADAATGTTNVAGTDAIKVAMLYKRAAVTPVKVAVDNVDTFERKPLAVTFDTPAGARFTTVVNHFKSKGSCPTSGADTDQGDGQSCWNARRTAQATELARWLSATVIPAAGDPDVLIIGDLNAYKKEDPIRTLVSAGYGELEPEGSYSYVFDGQWGSLDHALASSSLAGQVTGADVVHNNADEPTVLDYNTNFKTAGQQSSLYAADRFRASDHDPVLVGLKLDAAPVPVQILATNDYHGRLAANGAEAGAAVLAGAVKQLRAAQPNTVFAAAGDLIGASTFESFIQKDKPTIDALNEAGLDVSAVGNHELDQGYDDLLKRVMAPYDKDTNPYGGAKWQYIAANLKVKDTGDPQVPATWIKKFGPVEVGFVGAVTEHLPELVSPAGIAKIDVLPIVSSVNREAADLKANGADVVVLLVHEGAPTTNCADITGDSDFGRIVNGVNDKVDAIVSGHTHLAYNCQVPVASWADRPVTTRPVVSAGQYGTNLNQILLTVDPATGAILTQSSTVLPLVKNPAYPSDPATAAIVTKAVNDANVLGAQVLGKLGGPFNRAKLANGTTENRGGESTLGNLVAEVQREQTGAQIAVMNPGGLRADLVGNNASGYPADLTFRQAANVQPFANTLVTQTLTGAQLKTVLEQQWQPAGASRPVLRLGLSKGFTYTYDPTAAEGQRITAMWLDGVRINPTATYTVTANSFLAAGGDNFLELAKGTDKRDTGKIDLQSMVDHLGAKGTASPDYTQRSVGIAFPAGAPASYGPGQAVTFNVSSLAFSTAADAKDATVQAKLGNTVLGTFAVDNTVGTDIRDEYGRATVSFTVPSGTAAGVHDVVLTGTTTGTTTTVPLTIAKVATTTTITSSRNPGAFGSPITFTATVSGPVTSGTVQFAVDGEAVGSPVAVVAGQASYDVSGLAVGTSQVSATFSGDANTLGSSASVAQKVDKTGTLTVVTSSRNPAPVNSPVTFTATVVGPVTGGTVQFLDGTKVLATVAVVDGKASFTSSSLKIATYKITARFSGDAGTTGSLSPVLSQKITKVTTTTTLTSSASQVVVGGSAVVTATVAGASAVPTGTVSFYEENVLIATRPVVSGSASLTVDFKAVGARRIKAVYSGDAEDNTSTGNADVLVRYDLRVVSPSAGSTAQQGTTLPVVFQLLDADGKPIADAEAAALVNPTACKVTVAFAGAYKASARCATYDAALDRFELSPKLGAGVGATSMTIRVAAYPKAKPVDTVVPFTVVR
ncbi:ExeM/NucH family extracellular endonuclease [Aeromicrobium sp.]|uniref:ExeM/NucH family extracellular endonuclease n=1 Tax=Aeromicrobium sp. TaxID=1871063 RepID=UPI003518AC29